MPNTPDAALIFAAGFGTRMGTLTRARPKPLIPVAGRALLDHALAQTDGAGIARTVVNTHYLADQVHSHLAPRPDVMISHESSVPLETGGGLRRALPLLDRTVVFTLNSDAVWTGSNALTQLAHAWDPDRMDALLLLVPRANAIGHKGRGDFVRDPAGQIDRGPGAVYSGVQIVKTDGLSCFEDPVFSLNLLWDKIARNGRLHGIEHDGLWCDVGTPEGIEMAEDMLRKAHDV
ncbi:MAG: nucleotidyltransferase family protein [Brevirhabdus sp.]